MYNKENVMYKTLDFLYKSSWVCQFEAIPLFIFKQNDNNHKPKLKKSDGQTNNDKYGMAAYKILQNIITEQTHYKAEKQNIHIDLITLWTWI